MRNKLEEYSQLSKNFEYVKREFEALKIVLDKFKTSHGHNVKVFLQGSYKNKTSINSHDSDIDIVVYLDSVFNSNLNSTAALNNDCKLINLENYVNKEHCDRYHSCFTTSNYSYKNFKDDLRNYLVKEGSGNYKVIEGRKTIKCVMNRGNNFSFDIIPALEYRFYTDFTDENSPYERGNFLWSNSGERIINFPRQTFENGVDKNQETAMNSDLSGGTYKETVRIFKNISKNHLEENFQLPSFALESILFNVPSFLYKEGNKFIRCKDVIGQAISKVENEWNHLLEPNKLLFVKNIKGVTREKALASLREMNSLL